VDQENCFGSLNDDACVSLGLLGFLGGTRPSSLFQWDEPEDWLDRLMFDLQVSNLTWDRIEKMVGGR
jgi:hypothetical protein